ncbi:MAG: hypothetical protein FJW96_06300 [Actinobacteria bacterium]|nr:hypothetical protein [Actinomycetota bacterium]
MDIALSRWSRAGWDHPLPALDGPSTLVLAFGDSALGSEAEPWGDLRDAYPQAAVLGCSTAGEILGDAVLDGGLTVAVARFEDTRLAVASVPVAGTDSHDIGRELGARIVAADPDVKAVFVLSDGLAVNGSRLVQGFTAACRPEVAITGGLAADGDRFQRTWVVVDGAPAEGHVTAVGLSGPRFRVGHGSRGGWDIFGPERRVTRAEGNVLFELDGQPALDLYKHYLGARAAGLPATALLFPLAVRYGPHDERRVVRTILGVDEESRSMTFAGDIPEDGLAQLMRANFERLIDGAGRAAELALVDVDGPSLTVAISCVGRRLLLGERVEDELEAVVSAFSPGTAIAGFYSYGEISPITAGTCDLHNQTMTLTSFSEDRIAA